MKVLVNISKQVKEEEVRIQAKRLTPQLQDLIEQAERLGQTEHLLAKKEGQIYRLPFKEILRLNIENRKLLVWTQKDCYRSSLRLYQVKQILDQRFLQISQSEIVQIDKIDHLKLLANGFIELTLVDGSKAFSSRRYLDKIKTRLELYQRKNQ